MTNVPPLRPDRAIGRTGRGDAVFLTDDFRRWLSSITGTVETNTTTILAGGAVYAVYPQAKASAAFAAYPQARGDAMRASYSSRQIAAVRASYGPRGGPAILARY